MFALRSDARRDPPRKRWEVSCLSSPTIQIAQQNRTAGKPAPDRPYGLRVGCGELCYALPPDEAAKTRRRSGGPSQCKAGEVPLWHEPARRAVLQSELKRNGGRGRCAVRTHHPTCLLKAPFKIKSKNKKLKALLKIESKNKKLKALLKS